MTAPDAPPEALSLDGGGVSSPTIAELPLGTHLNPGDFLRWGEQVWRVIEVLPDAPGAVQGGQQVQVERLE